MAMLLLTSKGDVDGAAQVFVSAPNAGRSEPRTIWTTVLVQLCQRAPEKALKTLERFSDDYIQDNWFSGPKAYLTGRAHAMAGRMEAARLAWQVGLTVVDTRLKTAPENRNLHLMRGQLLALLAQNEEALREARVVEELERTDAVWFSSSSLIYAALGRADDALPLLEKQLRLSREQHNVGWPLTPALLRLDPRWDKIRDDPRFQALCADPAKVPATAEK